MNKKIVTATCLISCFAILGYFAQNTQSASLSNIAITLGDSRLSFRGRLAAGNTADSSVTINTNVSAPYTSVNTQQLVEGDIVRVDDANYTVRERVSADTFSITTALDASDIDTADEVSIAITASSAAQFTATSAVTGGSFRLLFPAAASNAANSVPDVSTFDFGTGTPATTHCSSITGAGARTPTSTASVTYGGNPYHEFKCAYTGTNSIGAVVNLGVLNLINPAPSASHTIGTADTYIVLVQHLDSGGNVIDSSSVSVGAIEAVQVTAEVAPQITFSIAGVTAATMTGSTICGVSANAVTTTATAVPFGSLSIAGFTNAAQELTVSTNASNGYVLTAIENDQMGLNGQACAGESGVVNCIDDTSVASEITSADWTNASTQDGFGYSLADPDTDATEAFAYNESGRTFSAKQFASLEESEVPATIMSDTTVTNGDDIYVCYRATISAIQPAGFYYNYLTYTATATF